jgi:hypothetical protein
MNIPHLLGGFHFNPSCFVDKSGEYPGNTILHQPKRPLTIIPALFVCFLTVLTSVLFALSTSRELQYHLMTFLLYNQTVLEWYLILMPYGCADFLQL